MGEVAPLGDGEGRKNIKFYSFLRAIRESPLQLMGLCKHCAFNRRAYVLLPPFFAIMLLKAFTLRGRWQPEHSEAVDG